MTIHNGEAIILARRRYSETSWIINAFTLECGRLELLAKGARRPKSAMYGHLDVMSRESLLVYERPQAGLDILAESHILDEHAGLRRRPLAFAGAGMAMEAARAGFAVRDPHPEAYRALSGGLSRLASADAMRAGDIAQAAAAMLEGLLAAMGYLPPPFPKSFGRSPAGGPSHAGWAARRINQLAEALGQAIGRRLSSLAVWKEVLAGTPIG